MKKMLRTGNPTLHPLDTWLRRIGLYTREKHPQLCAIKFDKNHPTEPYRDELKMTY
jgi:hypothetical protein